MVSTPPFALGGDAISIFQGCLLYKYIFKIVKTKAARCFFYKMCSNVRDPWETVPQQWQKTSINACVGRLLICGMIYVHPCYFLMMECFKRVNPEVNESLTKTETKKETFTANKLYLKCIIKLLISYSWLCRL